MPPLLATVLSALAAIGFLASVLQLILRPHAAADTVEYGISYRLSAAGVWPFAGALPIGVAQQQPIHTPELAVFAAIFAVALVSHLEVFHVRIRYDAEGLHTESPWRANRRIPWEAVSHITYSHGCQWHVIHTRTDGGVRLSSYVGGYQNLFTVLEARGVLLPPNSPDAPLRLPYTLAAPNGRRSYSMDEEGIHEHRGSRLHASIPWGELERLGFSRLQGQRGAAIKLRLHPREAALFVKHASSILKQRHPERWHHDQQRVRRQSAVIVHFILPLLFVAPILAVYGVLWWLNWPESMQTILHKANRLSVLTAITVIAFIALHHYMWRKAAGGPESDAA